MHILDALELYLVQLGADGRSPHTRGLASRYVKLLAAWLASEGHSGEIAEIDHQTLARFLVAPCATQRADGKPRKATTCNVLRSVLRTFFGYLHNAGEMRANPARLVRLARTAPPPPRSLSEAEEQRLLAVLDQAESWVERRDRVLFRLLHATGIRLGSALALRVEDLDLEAGEAWLRKTKGDRPERVFLHPETQELLLCWVGEVGEGYLFPGRQDDPLSARHVHRRFRQLLERAEIDRPASVHWLRHAFAERLYRRTGDILLVQQALLHRSLASTLVYARGDSGRVRDAIRSLKC